MSWAAVIVGGASLVGSAVASRGGKKAADAQVKGADAGIEEQRRQFDLIMQMLAPQRQVGNNALNTLNRLQGYGDLPGYGPQVAPVNQTPNQIPQPNGFVGDFASRVLGRIPNNPAQNPMTPQNPASPAPQQMGAPDMSVFFNSPDYQFRRGEGMRGIENSFAARGGAASGNALRALSEFNSNLASGEYGNFFNRNLALAGMGQAATSQGANAAQNTGANVANLFGQQGNARASGIANQTNAITGGLNDLASIYGFWRQGGFGG